MGGADNAAVLFMQRIEGRNLQRIFTDKAAGDTHPLTLSFWIRTNRPTGTPGSIEILQAQNGNRMFATSYTTGTQNQWEHVVIQIPADTAADIPDTNDNGLRVAWWLNSGGDFQGTAPNDTWQNINNNARNNVNLGVGSSVGDEMFITGIQLEVGTIATSFEHNNFGYDLLECQRYFQFFSLRGRLINRNSTNNAQFGVCVSMPCVMRISNPECQNRNGVNEIHWSTTAEDTSAGAGGSSNISNVGGAGGLTTAIVQVGRTSNADTRNLATICGDNTESQFTFDAEL